MELGSIPLAHYTSPSVCERLFGIVSDKADDKVPVDSNKVSPMRIGSSTYMNDPTEGEGLLELLNLQDLELENKADCPAYNAFFTCFFQPRKRFEPVPFVWQRKRRGSIGLLLGI